MSALVTTDLKDKKILIKPNILCAALPETAVTTHPDVLQGVLRFFKKFSSNIHVGDSPAVDPYKRACERTGFSRVCKEEGVELVEFKEPCEIPLMNGHSVKRFSVSKEAEWADFIVSVPKLKNHQQMYYTGALKNMFGMVLGLEKSRFHLRFSEKKAFAAMMVDLNLAVPADLTIMDAIVAMEGEGPRNGTPCHTGFLGFSTSLLALDVVASSMLGYDPHRIPILDDAMLRGEFDVSSINDVELHSDFGEGYVFKKFKRISYVKEMVGVKKFIPQPIYRFLHSLLVKRPFVKEGRCIKCRKCVDMCSAEAMTFADNRVTIDHTKCILCYCCHEVCPVGAIVLK